MNRFKKCIIGGSLVIQHAMRVVLLFALATFGGVVHGEIFLETDFEGSTSLPAGWTQSQIDTSDVSWLIGTGGVSGNPSTARSGTNNAILYDGNSADDITRLISPIFDTTGYTNLILTFWHTQEIWASDQDELKVFYSSDGGTSWSELAHYIDSVSAWTQRTVDIPTVSATSQIAFEGNAKWGYGVCLDDIRVEGFPPSWPEVSVNTTDAAASESGPNIGRWTITRSGDTSVELTVHYTLGGTSAAGNDYTVDLPSPITFGTGEASVDVTLTPVDDSVFEGEETSILTLTQVDGYRIGTASGTVSIADNEPLLSVSVTDSSASESGPDVGIWTITRSINTSGPLSVSYTLGGNATTGSDYTIDVPSPIIFADGETTKVITLTPVDDIVVGELDEVATLTLASSTAYGIDTASGTISIADNEPLISVTVTDSSASEVGPDTGTWTITRSINTSGPLTVTYTLSGDATSGSDYTIDVPSPIIFADGESTKVITLTPVDDTVAAEGDEVATLTLEAGPGYEIGNADGDISIYDDEGFDLNILVIGSTHSFSEGGESGVLQEKPFNPTGIAAHLENIIAQDPAISDSVNVVFDDIFKSKTNNVRTSSSGINDITARCYSLAQHFFWPDGKAERLSNLRGEAGTEWDYILLCGDPYIMANFPGMYAEGVNLIQAEVARSSNPAQVLLMAQWPENSSTFTADDFNEVVQRVGSSADLTVVPAGKVWDSYAGQDTDPGHPTQKGAYLGAASIYSTLYDRSASTSVYDFTPDGDAIADHALSEVQSITATPQFSGKYTDINVFSMKYVTKRVVSFRETGTSTEDRLRDALNRLDDVQRINFNTSGYSDGGTRWDFNYGRGNDWWEDDKDYEVDPTKYDRSYGFPMHHYTTGTAANAAAQTMPYGIDKYYYGSTYEDGTDLGIAYNMVRPNTRETGLPEGHDVRAIPMRLIWLKMEQAYPGFPPLGDNTHMNNHLNDASAAFMYTLLSGRCPVVDEPTPVGSAAWLQWLGHKTGYETAWQMSHLTIRAPGFQVFPSSTSATTLTPGSTETMSVRFVNPPQAEVTVNVSIVGPTAAIVSPQTLVFNATNYDTPQEVIVAGLPGASSSEGFEVVFTTTSDDHIYDELSDAWAYTTNRSSTTTVTQVDNGTIQTVSAQFTPVTIDLGVPAANATNTTFAGPHNGSITWTGPGSIEYTPTGDYLGSDRISYAVTQSGTQTLGTVEISVFVPDGQVSATSSDAEASEEGPDSGTFVISRLGATTEALQVYFSLSGSADSGTDYTLSQSSPVTLGVGQSSLNLTLTPVDDSVFGEREETAVLTILPDAAYPVGQAAATITIADNDNRAPTVEAGEDQSAQQAPAATAPGLYYGTVPGNIDLTTPNPQTQLLVDPSSQTENSIATETTEIYTGNIYDADGQISFTEKIDDKTRIWIDDVAVISDDNYRTRFSTANLNLAPGWHRIEIRISNGTGGSGPVGGEIGIGYDPEGGTNWQHLTDPGDGSILRVGVINEVDVTLSGSVDDQDGDPLTTVWSVESGPGPVSFADPSATATTATFTEAGTYTLRLTVSDGSDENFDELTITIFETQTYANWISDYSVGEETAFSDDFDKDGLGNGIENYFGTHPGVFTSGVLPDAVDTVAGTFIFTHPISENPAGDVTAAYRWSKNLNDFYYGGQSDPAGTTVSFTPGTPADGIVTVTATMSGTPTDKIFVDIEVTQE